MSTDTLSQHSIQNRMDRAQVERIGKQYSFSKILSIWALSTVPGGLLFWLGLPFLDQYTAISTGYLVLITLVTSYIWQLILAFLILKREGDEVRWKTIKDRLWLRAPSDPRTGKQKKVLWLWLIPVIAAYALTSASPFLLSINNGWARILPIQEPTQYSMDILFENPDTLALPARLFRSTSFAMIVHFSQSFYFLFLILGLVLGLA